MIRSRNSYFTEMMEKYAKEEEQRVKIKKEHLEKHLELANRVHNGGTWSTNEQKTVDIIKKNIICQKCKWYVTTLYSNSKGDLVCEKC
jgi:Zn finger protein HypA/HybF involved in hydrogenase expression